MSNLSNRVAKLEQKRSVRPPYVVRASDPLTADDLRAMAIARTIGHPFAVLPRKCATVADWVARYGQETLQ